MPTPRRTPPLSSFEQQHLPNDSPTDEPLEKTLFRMRANLAPKKKKSKKEKGGGGGGATGGSPPAADPADPVVALFADARDGAPALDPSTRNLAAWAAASLLIVGGERFAVRVNPPSIAGLAALPSSSAAAGGGGGGGSGGGGGNGTAAATALSNCRPPMVGYPLLPVHELHFADVDCCSWRWLRRRVAGGGGGGGGGGGSKGEREGPAEATAAAAGEGTWADTGATDVCYTPTEADLGCVLRVECVPARRRAGAAARAARAAAGGELAPAGGQADEEAGEEGASAAVDHGEPGYAETSTPVVAGPVLPAHVLRALAPPAAAAAALSSSSSSAPAPGTASPPPPSPPSSSFRVLSYNILANQYAANAYARDVLFGYCPPRFLAAEYRRQLVLAELRAHGADVCCLQECDASAFSDYYLPHLRRLGYEGRYTSKLGRVREGSATFWRASKFSLGAARDVDLRRAFGAEWGQGAPAATAAGAAAAKGQGNGALAQFAPLIDASPALAEALQKVTTIAQVTLLLPVGGGGGGAGQGGGGQEEDGGDGEVRPPAPRPLLVSNTHLFFHPYAPHIRTMHTAAILGEAAAALSDWEAGVAGRGQAGGGGGGERGAAEDGEDAAAAARRLARGLSDMGRAALLFVGDLNSDLNDGVPGVVELLTTGALPRDHWDWRCGAAFRWGKGEDEYGGETAVDADADGGGGVADPPAAVDAGCGGSAGGAPAADTPAAGQPSAAAAPAAADQAAATGLPSVVGVAVSVPFAPLRSADGLRTPYTNFTSGYRALLDYVWHDPADLRVRRVLPAPPEALLASFIPSESFPSDHLAIVFDFEWAAAAGEAATVADNDGGGGQEREEPRPAGEDGGGAGCVVLPVAARGARLAAARRLARGGVVALPTDTLYGLAADACSAEAVGALKAVKGRDASASPLAVAVAEVADVSAVAHTQGLPEGLLEALLPGPVTVLLRPRRNEEEEEGGAAAALALGALGATGLIGARVPNCEFTRGVCRALAREKDAAAPGSPPAVGALALTSANASGAALQPLRAGDFRELWPRLAAVFDGGPVATPSAEGSTVVDLSRVAGGGNGEARIVRAGVAGQNVALLLRERFGLRVVTRDDKR